MTSLKKPQDMKDVLANLKTVLSTSGTRGSTALEDELTSATSSNTSLTKSGSNWNGLNRRPELGETMLAIAHVIAMRSTCVRRSVGAVLVDHNNRVLSIGHNGPAKGMPHCTDQPCEGAKCLSGTGLDLCQAIHAEQNALLFCPDVMKIDKCFVTTAPCIHCVKMLMNTSCKTIIYAEDYPQASAAKLLWEQDSSRKWFQL